MNYNKIVELAELRKMKLTELSELVGQSKTGLYKTIANKSMKVDTLEKIASSLNVSISQFFDDVMTKWEERNEEYLEEISRLRDEVERLRQFENEAKLLNLQNDNLLKDKQIEEHTAKIFDRKLFFYRDFRSYVDKCIESGIVQYEGSGLTAEKQEYIVLMKKFSDILKQTVDKNIDSGGLIEDSLELHAGRVHVYLISQDMIELMLT